jgi:hypothetical protein
MGGDGKPLNQGRPLEQVLSKMAANIQSVMDAREQRKKDADR